MVRTRRELRAVYQYARARWAIARRSGDESDRFFRQSVSRLAIDSRHLHELPDEIRRSPDAVQTTTRAGVLAPLVGDECWLYPRDAIVRLVRCERLDENGRRELAQEALLAGNVLYTRGVGPRPYDALELSLGDVPHLALVADSAPTASRSTTEGVASLVAAGELVPRAQTAHDADGVLAWERLRVADPAGLVRRQLGKDARRDLHYGREIALRGGRYLYQSVPGVDPTGRRDSQRRWLVIASLLRRSGLDVHGRLVCDFGCNAGMLLAAALADGASWGLGWDLAPVADHGRNLLRSLGFTRFDLIGASMDADYPFLDDVPAHLRPSLDGALVLYLAIRHHVGFLRQLAELPWRALVYEGGETESVDRLGESLAGLRELCDFEIKVSDDFRDGETRARPVAVLVRR